MIGVRRGGEMADTTDSKSVEGNLMGVRLSPAAMLFAPIRSARVAP